MKRLMAVLLIGLAACVNVNAPDVVHRGTPGIVVAGSMGVGAIAEIEGTDAGGFIHTIVGASPHQTGDIAHVTFATPYTHAPFVIITGGSAGGLIARAYARNVTRSGFTVTTSVAYPGTRAILDYYFQVLPD